MANLVFTKPLPINSSNILSNNFFHWDFLPPSFPTRPFYLLATFGKLGVTFNPNLAYQVISNTVTSFTSPITSFSFREVVSGVPQLPSLTVTGLSLSPVTIAGIINSTTLSPPQKAVTLRNLALGGNDVIDATAVKLSNVLGYPFAYESFGGNDLIRGPLTVGARLIGDEGNDSLYGGAANDTLIGGVGNDLLSGGAGTDSLVGGTGNDLYFVAQSTDRVVEGTLAGTTDTVNAAINYILPAEVERLNLVGTAVSGTGNSSNNSIVGNTLNNVLNGSAGNDSLNGSAGNDVLIGGTGNDVLIGSSGSDTFLYQSIVSGLDTILGFDAPGTLPGDRINLASVSPSDLAFRGTLPFSGTGQVRVTTGPGTSSLVQVNTAGSLTPEFSILIADGSVLPSAYNANDFAL